MPIAVPLALAGAGVAGYTALGAGTAAAAGGLTGLQELSLGASVLGATGQVLQGQAASETASYNAEIAANNAKIARQNATATAHEGEINAAAASQKTRAELGSLLANEGASGVDVSSGSSVDTRTSAVQNGELNAINIRANAARQAYGYQTQAVNDIAQENLDKSEAQNAPIAADIGAGATLLGGITNPNNPFGAYLASQSMSGS